MCSVLSAFFVEFCKSLNWNSDLRPGVLIVLIFAGVLKQMESFRPRNQRMLVFFMSLAIFFVVVSFLNMRRSFICGFRIFCHDAEQK